MMEIYTVYIHVSNSIFFFLSGDFNMPINYMNSTVVSVFQFTKEAVFQMMKERRPVPPFRIYPAMLWSEFIRKCCSSVRCAYFLDHRSFNEKIIK